MKNEEVNSKNIIFTKERADAARERIRQRISEIEESGEEPSPLSEFERRTMRALGLKSVEELDRLLAQPEDPRIDLENEPPDEELEALQQEYRDQDRESAAHQAEGCARK